MEQKIGFLKARWRSIGYALAGLRDILKTEHNAWVHAACTIIALSLAVFLGLDTVRFMIIIIVISLVWITEALNTVLELVIDIVSPEYCETARRAKDIAATAVLFAAIGALVAGVVLLGPPLLSRLG